MGPVQHTYRYPNKDKGPQLSGLLDDPVHLVDNIYVWRTQKKSLWPLIFFFFLINFLLFHFVSPISPFPFTYIFLHWIYFIIFQEIIFLFPSYFYFLCFHISITTHQFFSFLCFLSSILLCQQFSIFPYFASIFSLSCYTSLLTKTPASNFN